MACSWQTSADVSEGANKSVKLVYSTHPSRPDLNHSRFVRVCVGLWMIAAVQEGKADALPSELLMKASNEFC